MEIKPELKGNIKKLELKPGDIIVVSLRYREATATKVKLKREVEVFFPGHKVFILDGGAKLQVCSPEGD